VITRSDRSAAAQEADRRLGAAENYVRPADRSAQIIWLLCAVGSMAEIGAGMVVWLRDHFGRQLAVVLGPQEARVHEGFPRSGVPAGRAPGCGLVAAHRAGADRGVQVRPGAGARLQALVDRAWQGQR
jgi:hypothetical protein